MSARKELPWEEFLDLHVVKKVAKLLSRRWGLGLGYVDFRAKSAVPPKPSAPAALQGLCQLIQTQPGGEGACCSTSIETLRRLGDADVAGQLSDTPRAVTCHAGLTELAAPIVVHGRFLGALVCGGFFREDGAPRKAALAVLDHRVAPLSLEPAEYRAARDNHPWLSASEVSYVDELIRAAAEEIVAFRSETMARFRGAADLESDFAVRHSYDAIIGRTQPMQELYTVLDRVVRSDSTVLVQGENGVGKELVAKAIHFNSDRKNRRFVVANCSAFNDNLLDSELFGHTKGSFTGAIADKQGLFEVADTGTFFLDEIGDMTPSLQVKVLRVIQEGTFTPVGSTDMKKVDVRLIAATNRDLKAMVSSGQFREDLYYRINVINLVIPPLRERRDDIELLIDHFLEKHCSRGRLRVKRIAPACRQKLLNYEWPGNVRELENEIERLLVLVGDEKLIEESLLSPRVRDFAGRGIHPESTQTRSLPEAVKNLERRMIADALERHNWNKTKAAVELKVSRRNLIRLVQKYELERPQ